MSDALKRIQAHRTMAAFKAKAEAEVPCEECDDESPVTAAAKGDIPFHGHAALWGVPSGDGRVIRKGGIDWDLETEGIPIIWDREDGDHTGMVLGRIDTIEDDGIGPFVTGRLFATKDPIAKAAVARVVELIKENAIGWSVALDSTITEVTVRDPEVIDQPDGTRMVRLSHDDDMAETVSSRLRHLAIVDTPAQPGARPILGPPPPIAATALLHAFPSKHFEMWPESRDWVPIQVDLTGRVWGHAAGGAGFRNGTRGGGQKYTRDVDPMMRNFHTGTATLDNGEVIRVGTITAGSLHADASNHDVKSQRAHHENSSTIAAKVRAWNDSQGRLCIAGSMIPGLDPAFAAQVAGLPISPEIWPAPGVNGITLVGLHAVPLPAWPVGV